MNFDEYKPFDGLIKLLGAFGSIGSNELTLVLDGPIDAPDGGTLDLADVQAAFTYTDNNNEGATGFTGFRHEDDASRIVLTLNAPLTENDLTGDPDSITAAAGGLIGAGTNGVTSNPVVLEAASKFLAGATNPADATMDDRWDSIDLAPHALSAGTADLDNDGTLDAVRVQFDQPVTVTGDPVFSVGDAAATSVIDATTTSPDNACVVDATTTPPTTATVAPRTDELWLCVSEAEALDNNATPHVGFNGQGVQDAFQNTAVSFGGLVAADEVVDIEAPVVRTRDYFDYGDVDTGFDPTQDTAPRRANGVIDTIEIFFGTGVDVEDRFDGSTCVGLDPDDWLVSDGDGTDVPPLFMETYVPPPRETGAWAAGSCQAPADRRDGPTVVLLIGEGHGWDTGVKPLLDHLGDDDNDGHVLTIEGAGRFPATEDDPATEADEDGIPSEDWANPVLLSASASQGFNQVTLTFSEPVKGLGTLRVLPGDLEYLDNNQGSSSSFTATTSDAQGSRVVLAATNAAPTAADLDDDGGDAVRPKYGTGQHPTGSTIVDLAAVGDEDRTEGNRVVYRDFTGTTATDLVTPIVDNSAPFVNARVAQDGNEDGFIDRVRVTFNEAVKGSGTTGCADAAPWSITVDGGDPVAVTRVTDTAGADCSGGTSTFLFVEFDGVAAEAGTGSVILISYDPPTTGSAVVDSEGNALTPLFSQPTKDEAPPVLMKLDGTPTPTGTDAEAETVDTDGDGIIDALRVRFSEPVVESSFDFDHWDVTAPTRSVTDVDVDGTSVLLTLNVPDNAAPDTSLTPTLEYDPGTEDGVRDTVADPNFLDGDRYRDTTDDNGNEIDSQLVTLDGAAPVILSADTELVDDALTLTFSEPVFNNDAVGDSPTTGDSLDDTDFDYINGNAGNTRDDSTDLAAVTHAATGTDADEVVLTFDGTPSDEDLAEDHVNLASVFDAVGNPATATRTSLDGLSNDVEAPARITVFTATAVAKSATENEITLAWTNPGEDSVRGDDLESLVIMIDDPDDSADAVDITSTGNTLSDVPTLPDPVAGASQTLTVTGVDSGTTYRFTIRAIDEEGNQGTPSSPASVTVPFFDGTAPGAITDLEAESTTGSSVTLKWTAPSDTDGEGDTIKVAGYQVRVSTSPITSFTQGTAATFTLAPTTLAVGGQAQRATVTGLDAETTYHFAVRAVDARPNAGTFDTVQATTGPADTTPPVGTLTVTSSTHPASTATPNDAPTFSWSGLSDPETPITYFFALNQQSSYEVTDEETETDRSGSTTTTSRGFTDVPDGTWHFHVRGFSQGGSSDTETYTIIILDPDDLIDSDVIAQANEELQESLEVAREDGDNTLRWTLPETDEDVAGIQVWRSTSPFELLVDLAAASDGFEAAEYVDEDAPGDATYIITLYFTKDPTGGYMEDVAAAPGYDGLTEDQLADRGTTPVLVTPPPGTTGDGLPAWLWVLIAVGLVGIVAAVVVPIVLSRRGREEPEDSTWQRRVWGEDETFATDEEAEAEAAGPEHFVECPKCGHGFEARGEKPVETTCPNCGVRGVLN